ncbi:DUF1924 domain-containing protein [Campylobacter sp. 50012-21]|uniref:DUF1924 domain-containing protein n=1 Tax=Campylobacter magnus TaxID=3026462 RepID=UPI0023605259|nr:DUF1924 domain-containing protein [Campylobacter magnus]MDD0846561.1 DUF1924 domain-containing protein [Campylobacter magnus]
MKILASTLLCAVCAFGFELNAEMKAYIDELKKEAKDQNPSFVDFSAKNGEILFKTENIGKENKKLSCVSCHGSDLRQKAQNIFTGKDIDPLAPSVNKARLSDVKEVKKWLKRNFKDVFLREGTAEQKGDVLYYIMSK